MSSALAQPPPPAASSSTHGDSPDRIDALKLYASGKSRLLAGETDAGLRDLEAAQRLDPGNAELLASLGEAQLRSGRRSTGLTTLRRAFALGYREPRALWLLSRDESRAGRRDTAGAYLALAWQDGLVEKDPALGMLIGADLGELLAARGYATAAVETFRKVLELSPDQMPRTASLADVPEVLRRRADLRVLQGDLLLQLGRADEALAAFRTVARSAGVDPTAGLSRCVCTLMQLGRPAEAAVELIDDLSARSGAPDDRHATLVRLVSHPSGGVGPLLSRSLQEIEATPGKRTLTVRRGMTRLAAACLAPHGAHTPENTLPARDLLLKSIPRVGPDGPLLGDLLDLCPSHTIIHTSIRRIVQDNPASADACAEAVIVHGRQVDEILALLLRGRDETDRLLAASVLRRCGKADQALNVLDAPQGDTSHLASGIRSLMLADLGRMDEAGTALNAYLGGFLQSASLRNALSGRTSIQPGTLELVVRSLAGPAEAIDVHTRIAEATLAAEAGDGARAEQLLEEALEFDAHEEAAHEALLALYSPSGAFPDPSRLTAAMRRLRQSAPSAQVTRRVVAIDLLEKSLYRQARPHLVSLVSDRGQPPSALAAFVRMCEGAARSDLPLADEGEAWLRERLASRPQSPAFLLALSRVLVAQGKAQEAADVLAERIRHWPAESLLRQREYVLREGLGLESEADAMALDRLQRTPRTTTSLMERAALHLRMRNLQDAASDLREVLRLPPSTTRDDEARTVADLLMTLSPQSLNDAPGSALLLDCFSTVEERLDPSAAVSLNAGEVRLRAAARPGDTDSLVGALTRLRARHPSLGDAMESEVRLALLGTPREAKDPSNALQFMGALAIQDTAPKPERCMQWFLVAGLVGDGADVEWLLSRLSTAQARAFVEVASTQIDDLLQHGDTVDKQKAEVAHAVADLATIGMRDRTAAEAHRIALRYDPTNPWVCNDYGFSILERGGDIAEAARLIEIAYKELAGSASVVDSMGWLRYKQGLIQDDAARENDVCGGMGAVSLLRIAAGMNEGSSNPEVLEHLGDALWRDNGDASRKDAVMSWRQALMFMPLEVGAALIADPRASQRDADIARIESKINAAAAGQEPPIAPVGISPDFTPRPEPSTAALLEALMPASAVPTIP